MKFRIRYADKVVGFLVIVAFLSLLVLVFLLGSRQRWFARDFYYKTYPSSATGLNVNMPVQLKGLPIGVVKSVELTADDRVEVRFTIYDKYNDRAKEGSLIEILVSPIGLGNQFVFHPGRGSEALAENALVPLSSSEEGKELIARGLGYIPSQSDNIARIMAKVDTLLDSLNKTADEVNFALAGNQNSVLGRTLGDVEKTIAALPEEMEYIKALTYDLSVIVSPDGTVIGNLESSIVSISQILASLEKTAAYLPRQMPQITNLITDLRTTLQTANDVLIALRNNPLLKNGIPEHAEIDGSGTNPRDIRF